MADDREGKSRLDPDESSMAGRIDDLVRRGLERYAGGDLDGAMFDWEHALSLDEDDDRARRYVDYVRQNYETISREEGTPPPLDDLLVPFGLAGDELEADYEVELTFGGGAESITAAAPAAAPASAANADCTSESSTRTTAGDEVGESAPLDEGWFLENEPTAIKLPPPPESVKLEAGSDFDALKLEPDLGSAAPGSGRDGLSRSAPGALGDAAPAAPATGDLGSEIELEAELPPRHASGDAHDFGTDDGSREQTPTAPAMSARAIADYDLGLADPFAIDLESEAEFARPQTPAPVDIGDFLDLELGPSGREDEAGEELTRERGAIIGAAPVDEAPSSNSGDEEFTVPGAELLGDASPPEFALAPEALRELGAAKGVGAQQIEPEEITVERPGIKANISLGDLEALNRGVAVDDRAATPSTPVAFRTAEDELTIERGAESWGTSRAPREAVPGDDSRDRREQSGLIDLSSPRAPTIDPYLPNPDLAEPLAGDITRIRRVIVDRSQTGDDFDADADTRDLPRQLLDQALAGGNSSKPTPVTSQSGAAMLAQIDSEAPANEADADRSRRRVTELLTRARAASQDGDQRTAVEAVELAFTIDPESAASQMAIHRHRDLIIEVFEAFLGDLANVPALTIPIQEVATLDIDPRGAFLLSRIDGSLSFEEILDIAGMATLDAYRYLCRMLAQGVLRVR